MIVQKLNNQNQQINGGEKIQSPPNEKLIHISHCQNELCPLKEVLRNHKLNGSNGNHLQGYTREFDQQFIPYYACPKCQGDTVKYCSQRCFQQDWFKIHQFECSGQMPEARDSMLLSDVQRIEASTPFIKEAYDESSLSIEQLKLEQLLGSITKNDIEFITSREANLGKGSYGEVQLAKHKATGIQIAVKKIEKSSISSSKIRETLVREIKIQKQLNHEYICRLYNSFEDKTTIYLALEYASKGNLFYLIRKEKFLSEDTAFYFFIQVCSGIYYLHKQGLIHRDIKPENILIKEGNIIKICDFGWCVQSDHMQQRNTFCGTLEYMAPEMIQNKNHNHTLDIWSLGILLYELVHGRAPFTGVHPREISDKIMRGQIRFKPGLSNEYKDLVNKILVYETTERIPLIKVFDHPWIKNFEKKYNLSKQAHPKKEPKNQSNSNSNQILQPNTNTKQQKQSSQQQQINQQTQNSNRIKLQNDIQAKPQTSDMLITPQISQNTDINQINTSTNNNTNIQSTVNDNSQGIPTPDNNTQKTKKNQQQFVNHGQSNGNNRNSRPSRKSRKTQQNTIANNNTAISDKNEDIMKELEDLVNEKKQTNKFLDDISDFDTHSTNNINKYKKQQNNKQIVKNGSSKDQRGSKQKSNNNANSKANTPQQQNINQLEVLDQYVHKKGTPVDNTNGVGNTTQSSLVNNSKNGKEMNTNKMDVYDYCDKMMKDLSHLDKQLENRKSASYNMPIVPTTSSGQQQTTNQLLNQCLLDNDTPDSMQQQYMNSKNPNNISHISHMSQQSTRTQKQIKQNGNQLIANNSLSNQRSKNQQQQLQTNQNNIYGQNKNMYSNQLQYQQTKQQQIQQLQQQQEENKQARNSMRNIQKKQKQIQKMMMTSPKGINGQSTNNKNILQSQLSNEDDLSEDQSEDEASDQSIGNIGSGQNTTSQKRQASDNMITNGGGDGQFIDDWYDEDDQQQQINRKNKQKQMQTVKNLQIKQGKNIQSPQSLNGNGNLPHDEEDMEEDDEEMEEEEEAEEEEFENTNEGEDEEEEGEEEDNQTSDLDDLVNAHNDMINQSEQQMQQNKMKGIGIRHNRKPQNGRPIAQPKSKLRQNPNGLQSYESEEEPSSEEEADQTFMQKLGGFLFFGCGGTSKR